MNFYQGCGAWNSTTALTGCYKLFNKEEEKKSWQEAREQCRKEGRSQGVSDADLAYWHTEETTERDAAIKGRSCVLFKQDL